MPTENTITLSIERFQQLIRSEQDANQLKQLIADAHENYEVLDRAKLALLNKIYIENKENLV